MEIKKKIFSRFLIIVALILLISAGAVKIHSMVSFSEPHDWNYYQLQRIGKNQTNFSFVVFGDNKNSITTFDELISRVNKEDALFAIDVGDLVLNGEKEYFDFFISQIEKLNKPLLTVVGNHELYDKGRASYYDIFGRFYYSFNVGNSYFIILDDANENSIDPWQMNWLESELQKSQNYKYRFVFMHVPLYDPTKKEQPGHSMKNVTFAKQLNELFDEYNVTMIFCSHIHSYYKGVWGKTPYIISGGAGAELDGINPNHYFYHYIKVDVSGSGVKYNVIRLKSPDFELGNRLVHTVWLYAYAFFDIHAFSLIILICSLYLGYYIVFVKKRWLKLNFGKKR
jgi:Icc-related predicted phosphoesterase